MIHGIGFVVGVLCGLIAGRFADHLPKRYGIEHLLDGRRRNAILLVLVVLCTLGITQVVASAPNLTLLHAALLVSFHAFVSMTVLAGAAIDLEHMILPNELTIWVALLCLATAPFRAVGLLGALVGAGVGLFVSVAPLVVYKLVRKQSGMGLGDAKLAIMAGAWLGWEGAVFVLFAGALQSTIATVVMHVFKIQYAMPESVKAEIAELRARAEAGDAEAKAELADDPMANEQQAGMLGARLPLGPFLALACLEMLFMRRWIVENVFGWIIR